MNPAASALVIEVSKLALQLYFTNMRLAEKTTEEINALFQSEKTKFEINKPEDLPDV